LLLTRLWSFPPSRPSSFALLNESREPRLILHAGVSAAPCPTSAMHPFAFGRVAHGLGRARSRGLDCMQEQALLTAIVQNLKKLCRFKKKRPQTGISACPKPKSVMMEVVSDLLISVLVGLFSSFFMPKRRIQLT